MSPAEVQSYFKAHESEFAQPESVTLNEILIPTPPAAAEGADAAQVAAAQAQAEAIEAKLAAGAKFEDLAKPAPTDPTAPKSVNLGEYRRGMLAKEIEDKAFALSAGQHTQPIRTKQGFIILQATQHQLGGDASFKQVEPQVEEALFMEQMQPKLREYLTKLREEAYVELKPGVVDTGASGNEMRLTYSAYTPPAPKKKKKFARARFRGRTPRLRPPRRPPPRKPPGRLVLRPLVATSAAGATSTAAATATAPAKTATTRRAGRTPTPESMREAGEREKMPAFGRPHVSLFLPRELLRDSVSHNGPDTRRSASLCRERTLLNPDGTITSKTLPVNERETRLSNRPPVKKVRRTRPMQMPLRRRPRGTCVAEGTDAPAGLADQADPGERPRRRMRGPEYADKPKEPDGRPRLPGEASRR